MQLNPPTHCRLLVRSAVGEEVLRADNEWMKVLRGKVEIARHKVTSRAGSVDDTLGKPLSQSVDVVRVKVR